MLAEVNLIFRDTSSIQGRGPVFFICFSTYFTSNQNIYLKINEAAKSNRLSSHHVASKSTFERFAPKDAASRKTQPFCIRYFWRLKCKSTNTITEWWVSCQSKPVCQKLARSCKKWKSAQKPIYALFAQKPSIRIKINTLTTFKYWFPLICHINQLTAID